MHFKYKNTFNNIQLFEDEKKHFVRKLKLILKYRKCFSNIIFVLIFHLKFIYEIINLVQNFKILFFLNKIYPVKTYSNIYYNKF